MAIVGQTASGKSALAMKVARATGGEIVAADSKTVYKGLDIGTAKPTPADRQAVRHHLLDVVDPDQPFSVARFQQLALAAIGQIRGRKRLPILVGGSGLYADSIMLDYDFSGQGGARPELRRQLESLSLEELRSEIKRRQLPMPQNRANRRYLIRSLERGSTPVGAREPVWRPGVAAVGLKRNRAVLKARIEARLREMLAAGLLEEARLVVSECPPGSEAAKSNIYAALRPYFEGGISLERALEDFVRRDLALAKKQLTWFKRHQQISWFESPGDAWRHIASELGLVGS